MSDDPVTYSYRGRPFAAETSLELHRNELIAWQASRKIVVPYGDIEAIRLFFAPRGISLTGYKGKIYSRGGRTISFEDRTWKSLIEAEFQRGPYRTFVLDLCRRAAGGNRDVLLHAGRNTLILALTGIMGAGMTGLLAVLAIQGFFQGKALLGLTVLGFTGVFGWWTWQYVNRNRPGFFQPGAVPERVLPPPEAS